MKKAVCIISGGMDSCVCAYMARDLGYEIYALHFDYNQRTMRKERECFEQICDDLHVKERFLLDASFIAKIGGNSLTDTKMQIPQNALSNEIPSTYVPFRNAIFLSIAGSLAEKLDAQAIFIGVVQEDSSGYPDCSQEFIDSFQNTLNLGTAPKTNIKIHMPLVHLSKAQIVQKAIELGVRLEHTWSCYQNESKACGVCDSCLLRLNGFKISKTEDKIPYENR